jgi:hypothetical protein
MAKKSGRKKKSPPPPKGWIAGEEFEPEPEPEFDAKGELRELVRQQIAAGYRTPSQLLKHAVDMFEDALPVAEIRTLARPAMKEERAALLARQQQWPKVTDYDRLDRAFAELERASILTRQNYWCCGTCGNAAIDDEIRKLKRRRKPVRGYTFFHEQDTEAAVDNGFLMLNYGAAEDDDSAAREVARFIVRTLKKHKLRTKWNGDLNRRIELELTWQRRWPHDIA